MRNVPEAAAESPTEGAPPTERRKVVPANPFVLFERTEIEQSISERFEKQVGKHRERLALLEQKLPVDLRRVEPGGQSRRPRDPGAPAASGRIRLRCSLNTARARSSP